jgi:hypothetical protein
MTLRCGCAPVGLDDRPWPVAVHGDRLARVENPVTKSIAAWAVRRKSGLAIDRRGLRVEQLDITYTHPAPKSHPRYMDYLKVCRPISPRCGRSLRTVDRALYQTNGHRAGTAS